MKYIVANWKSNHNVSSANIFFQNLANLQKEKSIKNKIVIAPPFNLLETSQKQIQEKKLPINLALQNLSPFASGSYTGEVGPENIKNQNIQYVILGHSERRKFFNETNQLIAKKIKLALAYNLIPILCLDMPYLEKQASFLKNLDLTKIIIAYEPLEAIGTGANQNSKVTQKKITEIQKFFPKSPILYGGSVKPNNVAEYLEISNGVLVGGASLEAKSWFKIMNS